MLKNNCILLLSSVFSLLFHVSSTFRIKPERPLHQSTYLHHCISNILDQCELGIKNVMIYDHRKLSSTYDDFAVLQPKFAITFVSDLDKNRLNQKLEGTETEAIIVVGSRVQGLPTLAHNISDIWKCTRQCTIIWVARPNEGCMSATGVFKMLSRTYATYIYYVCFNRSWPTVYTYDPYGYNNPSFWKVFKQELHFKTMWTFYHRVMQNSTDCRGFIFNRTEIGQQSYIVLQSRRELLKTWLISSTRQDVYFSGRFKPKLLPVHRDNINSLEQLLKLPFLFSHTDSYDTKFDADILFKEIPTKVTEFGYPAYPSYYGFYVIVSHNQGFLTPLERIGKYYGLWTLISLIIILIISFIVIWINADKKIPFALFDILRFLINSGIFIPINTLPLRIFFSVIFIYFLVIHATFSGHLAEFLTIPSLRKNIDSIEDLADPRIEIIYRFNYDFESDEIEKLLKHKWGPIKTNWDCMHSTRQNPKSVCILYQDSALYFVNFPSMKWPYWYLGKEFSESPRSFVYHPRFPLSEKFNWALMTMTETKIFNREKRLEMEQYSRTLLKEKIQAEVGFRNIALKDITFAFILLSIGLFSGFVCFIFEIFLGRKCYLGMVNKNVIHVRPFHGEEKKNKISRMKKICHKKLSKKRVMFE